MIQFEIFVDLMHACGVHICLYLCNCKGAALGCMVGQMTYGKRQFESLDVEMRKLIPPFHEAMNDLLLKVDADSTAFNSYMVHQRIHTAYLET